MPPKEAPAWKTVIKFDALEDDVVADALERMERLISEKRLTDPGEILHTFALKMLMSSEGIMTKNVSEILAEAKEYIDSLVSDGLLPPLVPHTELGHVRSDAAHGFAYWVTDAYAEEFRALIQYLIEARGRALKAKFADWATELLQILSSNGERFFEAMCHTKVGPARFGSIPILADIAPKAFVDAWMRSPKKGWYWIREALKDRYRVPELEVEKAWMVEVCRLLNDVADAASGFSKLRIRRIIPNFS